MNFCFNNVFKNFSDLEESLSSPQQHSRPLQVVALLDVEPGQDVGVEDHQVGSHLSRNRNTVGLELLETNAAFLLDLSC